VVGIASKGWRVMSKNFHGKQLTAFFLKKRGWGSYWICEDITLGHQIPSIKGTSYSSSTYVIQWWGGSTAGVHAAWCQLLCYWWMGSAGDKNGIREVQWEAGERPISLLPFFFSYTFLSLAGLTRVNLPW